MATCPACKSSKVYQGYRRTSLIGRIFRVHEYLCEHCNLQFQAFSLRPPRPKKRRHTRSNDEQFTAFVKNTARAEAAPGLASSARAASAANLAQVNVAAAPPAMSNQSAQSNEQGAEAETARPQTPSWNLSDLQEQQSKRSSHRSRHVCPQCGSTDTERRRRRLWERVAFYFSDIRAYTCRICGTSFYARRKHKSKD
jgi:transposase-like protein